MKFVFSSILATVCTAVFLTTGMLHAKSSTEAPASSVDANALQALQQMSSFLSKSKAFIYHTRTISEVPAKNGQMLTLVSKAVVTMARPNKLHIHATGEAPHFDFYYDGAVAVAYGPANQVYSTIKAPPTLDAMLPALEQQTGIRFATAGLLYSNPYAMFSKGLTSGMIVGASVINGVACQHLAFKSKGVNWEIWIATGARPFPLRIAFTYTGQPNRPHTLVEFTEWDMYPWIGGRQFGFHAPAGSKEVPFSALLKK